MTFIGVFEAQASALYNNAVFKTFCDHHQGNAITVLNLLGLERASPVQNP